jgi:hypothetical protein
MEYKQLSDIVQQNSIEWSAHGLERMLEKGISRSAVKYIISNGKMIESYPDDKPFPSGLFYGTWKDNPLHVVIAYDTMEQKNFVITAYWPDEEHFEKDFQTRRRQ